MLDIAQIIKKNREEAYELIKSVGGRIDFVEGIIKGSTDDVFLNLTGREMAEL